MKVLRFSKRPVRRSYSTSLCNGHERLGREYQLRTGNWLGHWSSIWGFNKVHLYRFSRACRPVSYFRIPQSLQPQHPVTTKLQEKKQVWTKVKRGSWMMGCCSKPGSRTTTKKWVPHQGGLSAEFVSRPCARGRRVVPRRWIQALDLERS